MGASGPAESPAQHELAELRARLADAEETLRAIRSGEVDALVVEGPEGARLFSLEGAETPYRVLVERMNEGALTLAEDGVVLYANRRFAEIVRATLEHTIGATLDSFIDPADSPAFNQLIALGRIRPTAGEVTAVAADGVRVPLRLALSPLPGPARSVCVVATDVTEEHAHADALRRSRDELELRVAERTASLALALDALREKETRIRTTLYSIGDGVISTDRHGLVNAMNPVAEQLTGWNEADAHGRPIEEVFRIVHEEKRVRLNTPVSRILQEGAVESLDEAALLVSRDGTERPVADSAAPVHDLDGRVSGAVLVFRDQTEDRAVRREIEHSRRVLQYVVDSNTSLIYLLDVEGRFLLANTALERVLGVERQRIIGRTRLELLPPAVAEEHRAVDLQVITSREPITAEERNIEADGVHTYLSTKFPVIDEEGTVVAVGGTSTDITSHKEVSSRLGGLNRGLTVLNQAALTLSAGGGRPDIYAGLTRSLKELTGGSSATLGLYDPVGKCLRVKHADLDPVVVADLDRALGGIQLAEASFPVSEATYQKLVTHPITWGASLSAITFGAVPEAAAAIVQERHGIDRFLCVAYFLDGNLYGTSIVAMHGEVPSPSLELVQSFARIVAETLRRLQAEEALQTERDKLRTLLNAAPVPIIVVGQNEDVEQANRAAEQLFGPSDPRPGRRRVGDIVGCAYSGDATDACGTAANCLACALIGAVRDSLGGQSARWREFTLEALVDGRAVRRQFLVNAEPLSLSGSGGAILAFHDITELREAQSERERLQSSLAQADRLASMGMLAAGVAHEINNPLTFVLYNLETLHRDLPRVAGLMRHCHDALTAHVGPQAVADALGDEQQRLSPERLEEATERLREALDGAVRIKHITRSLGTFARVETDELAPVSLQASIEHAATMAFNEIKYRARLVKDFSPVPDVLASEGKLAQVFLNLLINAAHAIGEGNVEGNQIRVRTFAEGAWACAEVSDTGTGIPPEHQAQIFDPFFTTKGVGSGSGLGLSICRNLILGFGGDLSFTTAVGTGTAFLIRLPRVPRGWTRRVDAEPSRTAAPPAVRGRILVVDDEPIIRSMIMRMLSDSHDVVTASSGEEGRALLTTDRAFDVIFCDLMMPRLSGMDLHAWLAGEDADLAGRVVFITGGAFTPGASTYLAQTGNLRVEKPFDADAFIRMTDELVAARFRQDS